jgi:hypothetical protein
MGIHRPSDDLAGLYRSQWYELYVQEVAYYNKVVSDPFVRRGITCLHDFFLSLNNILSRNTLGWEGVVFRGWYEKTGLEDLLLNLEKELQGSKHHFPDGLFSSDTPIIWHLENLKSLGFFSLLENYPGNGDEHSRHPHNTISRNQRFIMRAFYYYLTGLKDIALRSGKECRSVKKTSFYEAVLYFREFDSNIFEMRKEFWISTLKQRDSNPSTQVFLTIAADEESRAKVAGSAARQELRNICDKHYKDFPVTYRTCYEVQTIEGLEKLFEDSGVRAEDVVIHTPHTILCEDTNPHACKLKSMASIWVDRHPEYTL